MSRKVLFSLCAALAVFAFGTMTVGQASGATLKIAGTNFKEGFLAVYGFPSQVNVPAGSEQTERPIGGGLGRNFGFGQNLLFKAGGGYIGTKPLKIELEGTGVKSEACDSFIGGTLTSNHTGKNNPLSISIQFSDFQCNKVGGVKTSAFSDTSDRPWITEVCSPEVGTTCKPDPSVPAAGNAEGLVKIEDVSFELGPGTTVQGTVWGKWTQGAAKVPPCVEIKEPPTGGTGLLVTKSASFLVGTKAKIIEGKACLFSANNDWVSQSEKEEPAIEIANE